MSRRLLPSLILIGLLFLISACTPQSPMPIDHHSTSINTQTGSTPAQTASGTFQEYALPQTGSGMMRPTIDREGRIWFGEMGRNYLAVFDPRTQKFQQMTPPQGSSGIMGIAPAADGTIWFAEQYANYIGNYNPTTKHYQIYKLPTLTTPDPSNPHTMLTLPSAPNDLALDTHGNIWFTEMNADALGVLNAKTGSFTHYPISNQRSVQTLNPYGIAIDAHGMVWFTESSTSRIGRLDPATGAIRHFSMPGSTASLMEIANGPGNTIWATSFNGGLLLRFDQSSETFTPYHVPFSGNTTSGLYGITIDQGGSIWITVSAENVIARLDTASNQFIYYHIPTENSLPIGVVAGPQQSVWFTEAGSDKVGMLKP